MVPLVLDSGVTQDITVSDVVRVEHLGRERARLRLRDGQVLIVQGDVLEVAARLLGRVARR